MARVTGIGGVFLRARNPTELRDWYREHLGIPLTVHGACTFHWAREAHVDRPGSTTLALFPAHTDYFGAASQQVMLNLRVDDLAGLVERLRTQGVEVLPELEDSEFGRFAWCVDPEGNRIELWEPAEGM